MWAVISASVWPYAPRFYLPGFHRSEPNGGNLACTRIHPWQNESPIRTAAIPERRPATEGISGVIERVTFHNDDSGFCVLRVKTKGHREETTVVGVTIHKSHGSEFPAVVI